MEREASGFGASAEGTGKKAANSPPDNYSQDPARTGENDCFLLPVMDRDVMRCAQGPWLGWNWGLQRELHKHREGTWGAQV